MYNIHLKEVTSNEQVRRKTIDVLLKSQGIESNPAPSQDTTTTTTTTRGKFNLKISPLLNFLLFVFAFSYQST